MYNTIHIENAILNNIAYDETLYNIVAQRLTNATTGKEFIVVATCEDNEYFSHEIHEYDEHENPLFPRRWVVENIDALLDEVHADIEAQTVVVLKDVTPTIATLENTRFYYVEPYDC